MRESNGKPENNVAREGKKNIKIEMAEWSRSTWVQSFLWSGYLGIPATNNFAILIPRRRLDVHIRFYL